MKTAEETIKELYHEEITQDNESDDCGLSWTDVTDLMNVFSQESNKELLSEIEEFKSKVKGLSDLNNECIMKLRNNESYIHELESTVFNSEANLRSVQSQLQESQQMNKRLFLGINNIKTEVKFLMPESCYILKHLIPELLQSTTQEKGETDE